MLVDVCAREVCASCVYLYREVTREPQEPLISLFLLIFVFDHFFN